jgi:iron complex outermembrane receptor protein
LTAAIRGNWGTLMGIRVRNTANRWLNGASAVSLGLAAAMTLPVAVAAQETASAADVAATDVGDIVVTGSRIVRDGYQAPTPVTVLGIEEIQRAAPINLADQVNQLPALAGSTRMNTSTISAGLVGINALNLRSLGVNRTLVLFDGQRMPASTTGGQVDVNAIPNSLVSRVDVVTGGASAAWGSDAVSGVVNFVLDKDFTGLRGEVSGGITTYGDDRNLRLSVAAGTRFAGGRGHLLLSVEHAWNEGIEGIDRPWYVGAKQLNNPAYTATNGLPRLLARTNVGYTTVAPGAIVTAGPLRGIYFGPGGAPAQLNFGSIVSDPFMVGGDWRVTDFGNGPQALDNPLSRQNVFGRLSYKITDNIEGYLQASYSRSYVDMITTPQFNFGGLTIRNDNPFIPQSILARMRELNLASLTVGSWNEAIGGLPYQADRDLYRYVLGANGDFGAFGSQWRWDAYWNRNVSDFKQTLYIPINANYTRALDAVMGPNGVPVCRSTLTDPTNGCVPLNLLGTGVASAGALNYVNGTAWLDNTITQDTYAASVSGEPFSTWAGPVLVALGVEHRREASKGQSDALSKTNSYWAGNYKPIIGSYDVTEGFLEVAAPLATDTAWARSLEINGAVRGTDYSSSGFVTTWKIGATYAPIEDIKFRATRSRDIRAGNLADLFQPGQTLTSTVADPFRNNQSYTIFYTAIGNTEIRPEKGDTLDLGVIVQPRFLPGFTASVDYWEIKLRDAIATLSPSVLLNQCFGGDTTVCPFIIRDQAGLVSNVIQKPINLAEQTVSGIDMEASYRFNLADVAQGLGDGAVVIRGLATRYLDNTSFSGIVGAVPIKSLGGASGTPYWRYLISATYTDGPLTGSLTARGLSDGLLGTNYFECTSNCPPSVGGITTIDNNHVDGYVYFDLAASYKIRPEIELFGAVSNVANKDPAVVPNATGIGSQQLGVSQLYYDVIGRSFRAGVRFVF